MSATDVSAVKAMLVKALNSSHASPDECLASHNESFGIFQRADKMVIGEWSTSFNQEPGFYDVEFDAGKLAISVLRWIADNIGEDDLAFLKLKYGGAA